MADKGKATDDDIPGAGQPRPLAAKTETTVVDDTLQAPAGPTATAAGGLQPLPDFPGAPIQFRRAGRGGGGGSGHGGFSQSAPMMMLQQPLGNQGRPRAAPTAGAGETAARVTSGTVTAVGFPDASSQFGGALGPGGGSGHGVLQQPLFNPAGGSDAGVVTIQSLRAASRRRFLARRHQAQIGIAGAPQGQGIAGAPQGQEAVPDIEQEFLDERAQAPGPVLEPQGQGAVPVNEQQSSPDPLLPPWGVYVDGDLYDRAALEQQDAIWAKLQVELQRAAILTEDRHRGGPPPPPPPPGIGG